MSEYAIDVEHLAKKFGDFEALKGVTLRISKGEIFGLLGPNGAGKSTTINILLNLMDPTSGRVFVEGVDMTKEPNKAKGKIGLVTQETIIEPELTAEQNLRLFGRLYHMDEKDIDKKIDFLLALAQLTEFKKVYAGNFSGGMKRRLDTVKGLIHDPEILILDEPTTGLDIQNRLRIWELLKRINKERGVTILMTTQYLEEADAVCNRIAIMDHGKVVAMGTPSQLKQSMGRGSIIEVSAEKDALATIERILKKETGREPTLQGSRVSVSVEKDPAKALGRVITAMEKGRVKFDSVSIHEPTLDDVFLKLTGSSLRDSAESGGGESNRMMRIFRGGR
ncbi:MAG: ATP-binding cassette domain-containing protein [Candidatus Micrarchaeota archaeon]|nr:ATP-binding cassette domain-containing protein [Candidatus Micrarchaeota archaeon]